MLPPPLEPPVVVLANTKPVVVVGEEEADKLAKEVDEVPPMITPPVLVVEPDAVGTLMVPVQAAPVGQQAMFPA